MRRTLPRLLTAAAAVAVLALAGCDDSVDIDTSRNTETDPLGDIAVLDTLIYATNDDASGHAGSQVDLLSYRLSDTSQPLATVRLEINGQGYLAMAAVGTSIYLQPRDRADLIKVTPAGEVLWLREDVEMADAGWRGRGICFDLAQEQLVALYTWDDSSFVVRRYAADFTEIVSTSEPIVWDVLAPGTAPRALACAAGEFYVLGTDTSGADVVVTTTASFAAAGQVRQVGPGAVGLTVDLTQLWIAYDDRRLLPWRD